MKLCLPLIFSCAVAAQAQTLGDTQPFVAIDSGTLVGAHFGTPPNETMFLGIPYAAPPVGERRWKPPQPVEKWEGARKADSYGAACPQSRGPEMEAFVKEVVQTFEPYYSYHSDEDCLYLNVWTTNLPGAHAAAGLPVMFWIHGGGNVSGFAQESPMGPTLARKGVVVVSINYRLGALGFLAHPALTAESLHHASGNYGILDQIAALEWVRRNIAKFGGDPGNVTIFGESAGGVNVCYLMASPLARGLFQRAILESCTCSDYISPELKTSRHYFEGVGTSEDVGLRLMRDLNIADGPDALAKLRAKSPKEILEVSDRDPTVNFMAGGTVDGWVLTEQPATTLAQGRMAKVPVIAGSNADEGTTAYAEDFRAEPTLANYRTYLKNEFLNDSDADEFFRLYPAKSDADVVSAFIAFDTDYGYGFPVHRFAWNEAHAGQKVWFYYFTYPARAKFYAGKGAFHGIDMKFLTGWFYPSHWGEPNDEDGKLIDIMTGYWTQFAKSGDPNRPGLPPWPNYTPKSDDPKTDQAFEIGHAFKLRPTSHLDRFTVFERSLNTRLAMIPQPAKPEASGGISGSETFTHIKIRRHRSVENRVLVDKVGVLTFDDANRKLTYKTSPADRFETQDKLDVGYDDVSKIVFETTSRMRGGALAIVVGAAPLAGAVAGPAIAGQHVQDYWFYIEYNSGGESQQVLLEVPKDDSEKVILKAKSLFDSRVIIGDFPEKGETIDPVQLGDIKSKQRMAINKTDHPLPEVNRDKATIVVVCPPLAARYSGKGTQFKLHANDHVVAVNKWGTYSIAYLDPGKYRLVSQSENANGFEIQLEGGKIYYLLQNTFQGVFKGHTALSRNSPELVTYLMNGTYFSDWKPK